MLSFGNTNVGSSLIAINLLTTYEQHLRNAASVLQDKLVKLDAGTQFIMLVRFSLVDDLISVNR